MTVNGFVNPPVQNVSQRLSILHISSPVIIVQFPPISQTAPRIRRAVSDAVAGFIVAQSDLLMLVLL